MEEITKTIQMPGIFKYEQHERTGVQASQFGRFGIGYVLRGRKYIYYGDVRYEVERGEMFYFSAGTHYMEDVPEEDRPFEQITFFFTSSMLSNALAALNMNYELQITNNHSCANCADSHYTICQAWNTAKNFFNSVNQYLKDDIFSGDPNTEKMKSTELIYILISNPECCINQKLLVNVEQGSDGFEHIVQQHIFEDIPIRELARRCGKSLTSFKKDFKDFFHESPHKWIIRQRLMHSRLLLISTNKSISDIGIECGFPNTSHFIKLFKREYSLTPAVYRTRSREKTEKRP